MSNLATYHSINGIKLSLFALVIGLVCVFASPLAHAKRSKHKAVVEEVIETTSSDIATAPKTRQVSLSFKQMGAWSSVNLNGADGSRTLNFSIRADEVVTSARLKLQYDYSPSLIPELSHLRILVNEHVAAVDVLPQGKNIANSREYDLDPRLFTDVNFLRFNLIGHYTRQCEDPFHSSLWLTLSDLGRLELTLASKAATYDLKYLPAPFIDKRDGAKLKLPFVFVGTPSAGTIKAAGIVASWFGIQAGIRGVQFPAQFNTLPDGNAVVFVQGTEKLSGVTVPTGASVSIAPHPTNPSAQLLVVTGIGDTEMLRAARAIALISSTLAGQSVTVTKETDATPRKPYDAPAWVPDNRPVRLGELAHPEELRVFGWYPDTIRVNYRVSPDLFAWRTLGTPFHLKYRFIRLPEHKNSSLNVSVNNNFLHAFALNLPFKNPDEINRLNLAGSDHVSRRDDLLYIPPYTIGGREQLQMGFFFEIIKHGECQSMPPENLQASIDPESTLDFSTHPHYAAMPNLAYFASLGYPFTRMADLSGTAVVMPDRPNPFELGMYLTLMGRMGEATGYPVLRHTIVTAADADRATDADLLVIGSANSQALMSKWADKLPVVPINGERRVREPDATWMPSYRWEEKDVQFTPQPKGDLNLTGNGYLTTIMAFESPLKSEKSVVMIHADKAADLQKVSDVLTDPERVGQIKGDLVVVDDKTVNHTKVSATYYVGSLSRWQRLQWLLEDHPVWVGILAALVCLLAAIAAYRPVRLLLVQYAKPKA